MHTGEPADMPADETLRDVIASLSALPVVPESEVQRIVARAAAEAAETGRRGGPRWAAARPAREPLGGVRGLQPARPRWLTGKPMAAAAALVVAAGIGGFALRGATSDTDGTSAGPMAAASAPASARGTALEVSPIGSDARAEAPIATQFVLDAPAAARVSLVGGFNSWDAESTPLVRDPATGLWAVTLPLAPGRHVYAFMVDDSVLTLDPRAPSARDPELGTSGSVILVGTP